MYVRDIMVTDVVALPPSATIAEVAQAMRDQDVGSIPLVEGGRLVGVITDRDIVLRVVADGLDPLLEQANMHMTSNPVMVSPDMTVEQAAALMANEHIRRLPVVEHGMLVGYLGIGDLANKVEEAGEARRQGYAEAGAEVSAPMREG